MFFTVTQFAAYTTINQETGLPGQNGDLLVWDKVLDRSVELSSMGIRVDKEALLRQLTLSGQEKRKELYFHKRLLNETLPLSTRIPIEGSSTERSSTLSQTNRSPFRPGSPVSGLIVV